jgi:hypothetical protein
MSGNLFPEVHNYKQKSYGFKRDGKVAMTTIYILRVVNCIFVVHLLPKFINIPLMVTERITIFCRSVEITPYFNLIGHILSKRTKICESRAGSEVISNVLANLC